jgi:ATP-dependent Lhr-like helicase
VDADALGRFATSWHGIGSGRRGLEPLLDAIEQLQGAPMPASVVEREILPARVEDFQPAMLDTLMAAGEVAWVGVEPLGERDGRIALYLTDHLPRLRAPQADTDPPSPLRGSGATSKVEGRAGEIVSYLREHGASFFSAIHAGTGGGFPNETVDALWELVWKGLITNDTLHPLRAYVRTPDKRAARRGRAIPFRSRRLVPRTAEGRWSVVDRSRPTRSSATEWGAATAQQLLSRHGVVTRETVLSEGVTGGFSQVYQVLKAMEEAGRIRRGYFVAGLGAAQFATSAALDLLRSMRDVPETPRTAVLAATDPANPYGAIVKWPELAGFEERGPTRTVGSRVILVDGLAAAYLRRGERELLLFLPEPEPRRSQIAREVARMLLHLAGARDEGQRGMLIAEINGEEATAHPASRVFIEEGFAASALGLQARLASGTAIAGMRRGGIPMAEPRNNEDMETLDPQERREKSEQESEWVRGSGDEGVDIDPDSADSDVDRDDSVNDNE